MSAPRRPGGDDRRPPRRERRAADPRRAPATGDTPKADAPGAGRTAKPTTAKRPARTPSERDIIPADRAPRPDRAARKPAAGASDGKRAARSAAFRARRPDDRDGTAAERPVAAPRGRARRDAAAPPAPVETPRPPRPRPAPKRGTAASAHSRRPVAAAPAVETAPAAPVRGEPQRIAKLLARAGIASRREVERMIAEGRVAIDGTVLDTPATVIPSLQGVTVDGRPVQAATPTRLFLFNKPTGYLTTAHDPKGRPTIYDRLPADLPRVMPVGRLDMNTEGLLLLTTDGEFKRQLELPASGVPRIYRARAYGEVTQDQLEALIEGVEIEGVRYGAIDANLERRTGRNVWIELRLAEGKNREVRRVLEYLELQVSRLIRVAYGPFVLADLAAGAVVEVRSNDLVAFRQTLPASKAAK